MLSLPRLGCQVLGADLNRSESARNAADTCRSAAALRDFNRVYVRFGSSADKATLKGSVRFTSKSRQTGDIPECPLCAKSGHNAVQQNASLFDHLVGSRAHGVFRGCRLDDLIA